MGETAAASRRPIIAVIGARLATEEACAAAEAVGKAVIEHGYRLVTGGLGGVMAAASRGARSASSYREGDVLGILPGADPLDANEWVDIAIPSNLGYARNTLVVATATAIIAVGGGAGTLTEIAMAWQMGKPIVGLDVPGWSRELGNRHLDERRAEPILSAADAASALRLIVSALRNE